MDREAARLTYVRSMDMLDDRVYSAHSTVAGATQIHGDQFDRLMRTMNGIRREATLAKNAYLAVAPDRSTAVAIEVGRLELKIQDLEREIALVSRQKLVRVVVSEAVGSGTPSSSGSRDDPPTYLEILINSGQL